jgi:hypothetical protein
MFVDAAAVVVGAVVVGAVVVGAVVVGAVVVGVDCFFNRTIVYFQKIRK